MLEGESVDGAQKKLQDLANDKVRMIEFEYLRYIVSYYYQLCLKN